MRVSDKNIDRVYISSLSRSSDYKMVENHSHCYYELYYLQKGTCRFFILDNQYTLQSGDFIIVPPREVHYNRYLTTCVRVDIYFRIADLVQDGEIFLPNLLDEYIPTKVIHVPSGSQATVDIVINQMLAEEKVNDKSTYIMMPLLLKELFLYFQRFCVTAATAETENDSEIIAAVQYINSNYANAITLESLASHANLSPTYFSKKFHTITGMGMKEFLTYTRLKHAEMELLSTNHTITEIAMNAGFSNSNYFKDAFKKMYNASPREYRSSRKTDYKLEQSLLEGK